MKKAVGLLSLIIFLMTNVMCVTSNNKNEVVAERIDSLLNANFADDAPGCAIAI